MDVLFERVAGLDVGKASVTVCVRTPGPGGKRVSETRTFKTMTRSLAVMADWLEECGVTLAAMESTATYWKPVFYCLEERMECWLLNAAHMKAVPGRKTDVKDAEWIAQLLEHGLLRSSFVPPPEIRQLRNLTRYRLQVMGDRTRDAGRLEKLLEDASIKLSVVASNITGTSARDMLGALVAGERDPAVMADFARNRMRRKLPDLAEALTGRFDEHHALLVGSLLRRLEHTEATLRELDAEIVARMAPWDHQLELLRTIPGVGVITSQVFIAETGGDMSRFGSAEQLAAWAGVAPAAHESAGKRTPAGTRQGNKFLTAMLVEAANSAARTKDTYLSVQFKRIASRRGHGRAAVAVAHSMLVSAYWMLIRDEPYQDLGPDWLAKRNDEAHARRLVAQLERLGHTVVLDPVA